jgi:hypothetical protein
MQLLSNRSLALTYAALAILPFGLLIVLLQFTDWQRLSATIANPYVLSAIGTGSIGLSILSYPNKSRRRYFWLYMVLASLAMSASWAVALTHLLLPLPMLMYCIPAWQSWRLYRRGDIQSVA